MKPNLFSIIIPVKKYNPYCDESLGACSSLYPGQEILFCPDEPTQVGFSGVRVMPSGPAGPSAKRDLCLREAQGEILAFLDDDAYPAPGWLEAAAEVFQNPEVAAVGGPAVTPRAIRLNAGPAAWSTPRGWWAGPGPTATCPRRRGWWTTTPLATC